jgi:hypothetical protein
MVSPVMILLQMDKIKALSKREIERINVID